MSSEAIYLPISCLCSENAQGAVTKECAQVPSSVRLDGASGCAEPMVDSSKDLPLERPSQQSGEFLICPSEEILLDEIAHGSKEALGILFRRYRRSVLSVAKRILRDETEAEDLCQEVFLMIFQKAKLFDASRGKAPSWIIQIAYHRAMNRRKYLTFRRHYNSQEFDEEHTTGNRRQSSTDDIDARALLNRFRGQLSEEQRRTLELHFFEGYSLREIAEKSNQTLGNVRHHYYRGLERLRANVFPQKDS
jgi:RNA polymerase sigma-70 factor (ECF subfamily)